MKRGRSFFCLLPNPFWQLGAIGAVVVLFLLCALKAQSPPNSFSLVTLAVPATDMPIPMQVVIACVWQQQLADQPLAVPWWSFGGFGITCARDSEQVAELKANLQSMWTRVRWDAFTFAQARRLAVQELQRWQRDPFQWLMWQARSLSGGRKQLDVEQPLRVGSDEVEEALKRLSQRTPLLFSHPTLVFTAPSGFQLTPPLRLGFQHSFRFPHSQRAHALWWTVVRGDPAVAMVAAEWLGGGTEALWFQLLRGNKPLSYHALTSFALTPWGIEVGFYGSTEATELPTLLRTGRSLPRRLREAQIDAVALKRAKELAHLRYQRWSADPLSSSRLFALWLMAGRQPKEWTQLPDRLATVSPDEVQAFCHSLSQARWAELLAVP